MKTALFVSLLALLGVADIASAEGPLIYPDEPVFVAAKTRVQVVAELREAQRLGLTIPAGERDAPIATAAQERQIAQAGRMANGRRDVAER